MGQVGEKNLQRRERWDFKVGLCRNTSIPSTTWQLTTVLNSSPRGCDILFWPLWVLHAHGAQTYMQAKQPHILK